MVSSAFFEQKISSTTILAPRDGDTTPTTCSKATEQKDGPRAPTPTSPYLLQGPACGAASGSSDNAIYISSDPESESDCEADNSVPSLKAYKGSTRQPISPSPAPTISTLPNTPRAVSSGLEIDGDFGDVQHSFPPSLVSASQRPQQRGRVELPQQTEPHESASQNVPASSDFDGGGRSSEIHGEDGGHSRKRTADCSPLVISSDDSQDDGGADDSQKESLSRPHKRQKVIGRLSPSLYYT